MTSNNMVNSNNLFTDKNAIKTIDLFRVIYIIVAIGYIIYEILQPYLPKGVFDWIDIYGTLIGGVASLFIWFIVNKLFENKVIYRL